MASPDISRRSDHVDQKYNGLTMQMGRVVSDTDLTDLSQLHAHERQRTRGDVIGPAGSPDAGYRVGNPSISGGQIDFTIEAGTFYLGGIRLHLETPETFSLQDDWLRNEGIAAPAAARQDLVYLETWLQPVAAEEDSELYEPALAAVDTSTRMRAVARVRVRADVGTTS